MVFERRIPPEIAQRGAVGAQLRDLRDAVTRYLSQEAGLRPGDHIFVFADGMTQADFDCLVTGTECDQSSSGVSPLTWGDKPAVAQALLSRMLQLPHGPRRGRAGEVLHREGAEFLHVVYDGDPRSVDCLIRREVTAPMTMGATFADGSECPVEGDETNSRETRAISRVEMSMAVQFSAALAMLLRDRRPVESLLWVWALLRDKNYDRQDTLHGIRADFGIRAKPVVDLFNAAFQEYRVIPRRTKPEITGPYVRPFEVRWARTENLRDRQDSDLVSIQVGNRQRARLGNTLEIGRGFLREPWAPAVDELRFEAELAPMVEGRLLAVDLTVANNGRTEAAQEPQGDGRRVTIAVPGIDQAYQAVLRTWRPTALHLSAAFDFLIAGGDAAPELGFVPIPAVVHSTRDIHVVSRPPSTREAVALGGMSLFILGVVIVVLRPWPFEVKLRPNPVEWELPGDASSPHRLEIVGYTEHLHRRLFSAVATVSMEWELLVPVGFPLGGDGPVLRMRRGKALLASTPNLDGAPRRKHVVRWKPGTRRAPTTIDALDLELDERRFASLAIAEPVEYGAEIRMRMHIEARALLKLRDFDDVVRLPVRIRIREVQPTPSARFEVDSIYRRLGLDCSSRTEFGSVILGNRSAPGTAGVPRPVEVSVTIALQDGDQPATKLCFADGTTKRTAVITGNDELCWRVCLHPDAIRSTSPRLVSGLVTIEWKELRRDERWGRTLRWSVMWVPTATRLAGLDLGTSGTRLYVQSGARAFEDERVLFPIGVVNDGDTARADEFPSMVLIDEGGRVVRAGGGPRGIHAEARPLRFVQSPKAQLLAAVDSRSATQAKKDIESYVQALGRMWSKVRDELGLQQVKLVVTVPWTYSKETTDWYGELVRSRFKGAVFVSPVREAEAAAYFHILRQYVTFEGQRSRFPRDRQHRTLVVDLGAGTVDFAVIGTSAQSGRVTGLQTLAHNYSLSAGDRYDELLLERLFRQQDVGARMGHDRRLRDEVRRFKERELESMLQHGQATPHDQWGMPVTAARDEFLSLMEPFFESAITGPLDALARRLSSEGSPSSRPFLDEVLFAGRGIFAVGCRERIEADVRRLFVSAPKTEGIQMQSFGGADGPDVPWAIVRGALTFGRAGDVLIGTTDLSATRDAALLVDAGGTVCVRIVKRIAERLDETESHMFSFPEEVRRAWVVSGAPMLTPGALAEAYNRLARGAAPDDGVRVLATWLPKAGTKRLDVEVTRDERARFE